MTGHGTHNKCTESYHFRENDNKKEQSINHVGQKSKPKTKFFMLKVLVQLISRVIGYTLNSVGGVDFPDFESHVVVALWQLQADFRLSFGEVDWLKRPDIVEE